MDVFGSIQGMPIFVMDFSVNSEKILGAEYPGFTADHCVVDHFQQKRAALVKIAQSLQD